MTEQTGEAPAASPVPHCYRHPGRETYISCTRCGRPICPECMIPAAVGHHCPTCVAEGRKTTREPRTAVGGRISTGTPVTFGLIAVNVVIFLITAGRNISIFDIVSMDSLFDKLAMVPVLVDHHHGRPGDDYRLVTSMFLHYNVIHILFNMWALYVVGIQLEHVLGRWRYLGLYFVAGLGGSVATYLFSYPLGQSAGASGAIFGLFAAFFVIARRVGANTGPILWTIGINLAITFTWSGISKTAHVGGLVVGAVAAAGLVAVPPGPRRGQIQAAILVGLAVAMLIVVLVVPVTLPVVQQFVPGA